MKNNSTIKEQTTNDESKECPLGRWRRIARRVAKQQKWTKLCIAKVLTDSEEESQHGNRITFNVNHFKAHVQFGRLSDEAKHLFEKDPEVRTDAEIKTLYRVVDKLQCFAKYSRAVKEGLAKFVYYSQFEAGRIIVQQGQPAVSFYFIVRGSVKVVVKDVDRITGKPTQNVVGEILAGDSFGELALLHNTKRRASIICKEDTEFLRLDKTDFDQVLRETYQKDWDERMIHLQAVEAFKVWPLKELRAANTASKLVEYPNNTILLKDELEPPESVSLIKSGTCMLVKKLNLIKRKLPFGREKLILPPDKNERNRPRLHRLKENETMLKYFLVIRTLKEGDYFGVGENMTDSFIITQGKVELMLVPRAILESYNRGKILKFMRDELPERKWTRQDIFKVFLQSRKWDKFKKQAVEDIVLPRSSLRKTCLRDIPNSIRAEHTRYYCEIESRRKRMQFQNQKF